MKLLILLTSLILFTSCASQLHRQPAETGMVSHVVLLWLKDSGNTEHQQTLRDAADQLRVIPGLLRVDHGPALPSDRKVVDDSFDIAYVMLFESEQAVRDYDPHPVHRDVADNTIKPLVQKVIVYDVRH